MLCTPAKLACWALLVVGIWLFKRWIEIRYRSNRFCSFFIFTSNSQILDLSIFVQQSFLFQKLLYLFSLGSFCSSLQFLKLSAVFVWCCSLIAFAETVLPYLKQTTFFRKQVSHFNYSLQRIAKFVAQTLHLGKGSGYAVNRYPRAFCDVCTVHGTCPQEGATPFPGHIYIYMRTQCISLKIVFVNVGLASLAQLCY